MNLVRSHLSVTSVQCAPWSDSRKSIRAPTRSIISLRGRRAHLSPYSCRGRFLVGLELGVRCLSGGNSSMPCSALLIASALGGSGPTLPPFNRFAPDVASGVPLDGGEASAAAAASLSIGVSGSAAASDHHLGVLNRSSSNVVAIVFSKSQLQDSSSGTQQWF